MKIKIGFLSLVVIFCMSLLSCKNSSHAERAIKKHFPGYEIERSCVTEYGWYTRNGTNIYLVVYDGLHGPNAPIDLIEIYPILGSLKVEQ